MTMLRALCVGLVLVLSSVSICAIAQSSELETPEDYIINKFEDHDIIFLGENHYIKEEVVFVQNLIPILYKNGIRILGLEFAGSDSQEDIIRLITDPVYNESLAIEILRHWRINWPYKEYADIFKAAWKLNSQLPDGAPKFTIVGLDEAYGYEGMELSCGGLKRDRHMAYIIKQRIIPKIEMGEKALIYSHITHAWTKYYRPNDACEEEPFFKELVESGCVVLRNGTYDHLCMGNWIYESVGDRCITVAFHGPETMELKEEARLEDWALKNNISAGFDLKNAPFDAPILKEMFDGYLVIAPITKEHPVEVIDPEDWFDGKEVLDWTQKWTELLFSAEQFIALYKLEAEEWLLYKQGAIARVRWIYQQAAIQEADA